MATKNIKKKSKQTLLKKHLSNKRIAFPLIALIVIVGGIVIYRSQAAARPFTRLECYGVDHQGYKDTEQCYAHSKEGITARSFVAVFNRTPETEALKYWTNVYNTFTGSAQQQLITKLLDSSEAKRKLTGLESDRDRVTYLYNSVLKRKPDSSGATYWETRMKVDNNLAKTITSFIASNEAYTKTHKQVIASINTLPGNWWPTRVAKTVSPRGAYSNWTWNPPTAGFNSMEHTLTVDSYKPGSSYFWSHQFKVVNGDGGYIGLQSTGVKNPDGSYRKQAVFSMFNSAVAADSTSCKIETGTFDGAPGSGTSCIIRYDWVQGRNYRLKTTNTAGWWTGTVIDTVTGKETIIGKIKVPSTWKGMSNLSVMWTENFVSTAQTCDAIPYSKVRFTKPLANGSVKPIGSSQNLSSSYQCNNSRIAPSSTGVTQEMGL